MGQREPISSLSRVPLPYTVTAQANGAPWAPGVGSTFEAAYLPTPLVKPTNPDWVAGSFETDSIGSVVGLVVVGPGSAMVLAPGEWWEWVRLTDPASNVLFVDQVGSVIVI
jgi:hypothetical protein